MSDTRGLGRRFRRPLASSSPATSAIVVSDTAALKHLLSASVVRLRIVRQLPSQLEDFELKHLRFGASYEINRPLSELLLLMGIRRPR
jgi:hypothetical protein